LEGRITRLGMKYMKSGSLLPEPDFGNGTLMGGGPATVKVRNKIYHRLR
ncbi:hypothetical protein A2U01_0074039, partial [Trifolium medium]|nr:hypothetical protein [Trifolium medium]